MNKKKNNLWNGRIEMPIKKQLRTFETLAEFRQDKCMPGSSQGWSKAELISFCVTHQVDVPGGINNANKTSLCRAIEKYFTGKDLPPTMSTDFPPTIREMKSICRDLGVIPESKWRKADYVKQCWEKRKKVEEVAQEILKKPPTIPKLRALCKKLNVKFDSRKWKKADYVKECWNIRNDIAREISQSIIEKPPPIPKLKEICDDLGIEYTHKWRKADYVEKCWEKRNDPRPKPSSSVMAAEKKLSSRAQTPKIRISSMKSSQQSVTRVETQIPVNDLKLLCRERGIKIKKGWEIGDLLRECFKDSPQLDSSFSIGEKEQFTGKIKREANNAISNISALLYLLSRHHEHVCLAVSSEMVKKTTFGHNDYCDFELCWTNEVFPDGRLTSQMEYMIDSDVDDFWKRIRSCKKRFVLVPLYLSGVYLTNDLAHHNYLIIDKHRKTMERFEPNGHDLTQNHIILFGTHHLDALFRKITREHKYKYLAPIDFCPAVGPQQLEKMQLEEVGAKEGGFCTFWSIWYADQRFKYPDEKPRELMQKLMSQFKRKNIQNQMRTFIRNYIGFLEKERKQLIKDAKKMKRMSSWSDHSIVIFTLLSRLLELEKQQEDISSAEETSSR